MLRKPTLLASPTRVPANSPRPAAQPNGSMRRGQSADVNATAQRARQQQRNVRERPVGAARLWPGTPKCIDTRRSRNAEDRGMREQSRYVRAGFRAALRPRCVVSVARTRVSPRSVMAAGWRGERGLYACAGVERGYRSWRGERSAYRDRAIGVGVAQPRAMGIVPGVSTPMRRATMSDTWQARTTIMRPAMMSP